jgi:DNA polymerase II large subunit
MKALFLLISIFGISIISFSQVKGLNSNENQKQQVTNNSVAKPLNQSNNKPSSRVNVKRKIKQVPRKENHEIAPKKD